jgi:hypothetical protein
MPLFRKKPALTAVESRGAASPGLMRALVATTKTPEQLADLYAHRSHEMDEATQEAAKGQIAWMFRERLAEANFGDTCWLYQSAGAIARSMGFDSDWRNLQEEAAEKMFALAQSARQYKEAWHDCSSLFTGYASPPWLISGFADWEALSARDVAQAMSVEECALAILETPTAKNRSFRMGTERLHTLLQERSRKLLETARVDHKRALQEARMLRANVPEGAALNHVQALVLRIEHMGH